MLPNSKKLILENNSKKENKSYILILSNHQLIKYVKSGEKKRKDQPKAKVVTFQLVLNKISMKLVKAIKIGLLILIPIVLGLLVLVSILPLIEVLILMLNSIKSKLESLT